jgi:ribosomal protein S6
MKHYEAAFIITPELSEDEAKAKMNEVTAKVQEIGGTLEFSLEQRTPIKRRLAYPIQKKEIAYLASVYFTLGEAKKIKEIKSLLDEDKAVLRSLIVIHKEQKKEEVPHLPRKEEGKEEAPKLAEATEETKEEAPVVEETPVEEVKEEAKASEEVVEEQPEEETQEEVKKEDPKAELQDVDKKLDEILE